MLPMLAHRYKEHRARLRYPLFVQPKLNGVRMLFRDGQCMSRDEKTWHDSMLLGIRAALAPLGPDIIFDGELYFHGMSLQQINAAIAVNRVGPSPKTELIQYHIFDCIFTNDPYMSFEKRTMALHTLMFNLPSTHVRYVQTELVIDELQGESLYAEFRRQSYEGMMYRIPISPYGFIERCSNQENRWPCLIKRKDWLDDEFECVGTQEGEGKYTDMVGSLVFQMPNGKTFTAGSGLSDMQRQEFWDDPPVRRKFRIRYEMLSDTGVPLKPTIPEDEN
jgi:ATP-dependent DNA ligase